VNGLSVQTVARDGIHLFRSLSILLTKVSTVDKAKCGTISLLSVPNHLNHQLQVFVKLTVKEVYLVYIFVTTPLPVAISTAFMLVCYNSV
jgi:hypothetical protein